MIQIYSSGNTEYEKNGNMTILPSQAEISVELNGSWQLDLKHPIDNTERWKYIQEDNVIKLTSFNGDQLFRIREKKKDPSGITVIADPIFMDAMYDCFLTDVRPTEKNGQEALDIMTAPNAKYSGKSDITKRTTAYYEYKNLIEAINGDEDNSFINRWGGEILYDNFEIIINERVGGDYGVTLQYGKNIQKNGITESVDMTGIVTRIYPKAYNGYKLSGSGYVDSPVINSYPIIKVATITFEDVKMAEDAQEDDEENGVTICNSQEELDTALRQKCNEQFSAGIDKPAVNITVDMVILQNTEQYKNYAVLEQVSLGDTVHCRHTKLGITTDARVISLKYDAIKEKVTYVELGEFTYNYFNNVSSSVNRIDQVIRKDGTLIADKVAGVINGARASLRAQYNAAKKQDVTAILFENLDKSSALYGAMCLGTQGFQIANERTEDGKDWKWSTFGTANGFFADLIVAGTMLADRIRGGELLSQNFVDGESGFKLDLNNGIIEAVQLLIKTAAQGRMVRGFSFEDGSLKILGTDGETIAHVACTWSYPDGPDGVPSGWSGRVAFGAGEPVDNYFDSFWVNKTGACGIHSSKYIEIESDEIDLNPGKMNINDKETKTGRIEFSDGTYIDIQNGYIVGGNSKAGAF